MKASTNCDLCQFQKFCPMVEEHHRLPRDCPIKEAKRKGL